MPDDPDRRMVVKRETRRVGGAGDLFRGRRQGRINGRHRNVVLR